MKTASGEADRAQIMVNESTTLPLRCTCGALRGVAKDVAPHRGVHLSCYCRDCQCFAWFLERPEEILDRHGGTEVFQLTPARVELTTGHEHLACMRLSPKGLMRWYASCCNTPIGNTMAMPRAPFVGLISTCWDSKLGDREREHRVGPLLGRVNGPGHADEDGTTASADRLPLRAIGRSIRMLAGGWLRREHRPSPFFDLETGQPRVEPKVLSLEERQVLRARLPATIR